MKHRTILHLILLAAITLTLAQACSKSGNSSTSSSTSRSDFASESRLDVDKLEVTSVMSAHHLKIRKMSLTAGQLTFRLLTPAGDVQWEQAFTAPADFKETRNLDTIPGTWTLEIKTENATGYYDIQWQASN